VRLAVAATPDVAIPALDWLLNSKHEIATIITQPDRPVGRGRTLSPTIVSRWASEHSVPVFKPAHPNELQGLLSQLDLVITIGYGVLLPVEILSIPRHGFLNLHFSLLPAYRGAAPAQRALENGESATGVTVFQLDKGMDTGPIFTQKTIVIDPRWRSLELLQHLSILGVSALSDALEMIESGQSPTPQVGTSSLAPKISKEQARLDFSLTAHGVVNRIRAFTPSPGSWTVWSGEVFKISNAIVAQGDGMQPGQIFIKESAIFVQCGEESAIELLEVTPSGKKEMSAIDWSRGARLIGGEYFG
jgi:methionyl-tRNA formyltransferase